MADKINWHEKHDRKSIKDSIDSKYGSYVALQSYFKYVRDTGGSVFSLDESTGRLVFSDDMKMAYSAIFDKLGELEESQVKCNLKDEKLTKEVSRIKGVIDAVKNLDKYSFVLETGKVCVR